MGLSDFPTAPDFKEILMGGTVFYADSNGMFLSICKEIQTLFIAGRSEVVIFAVRRRCFKYITRLQLG